jgi:TetR/AcrR family transcriptional regulator, repressor of fatR-cypB operon
MNIHSKIMARAIDESKIERIKEAALQMIVSNGFGDASISKIAKKAGVAEGYLYSFYKSKSELIEDLLYFNVNELADKLEGLLDDSHSIKDIIEQLIRALFAMANHTPDRIKFLYVLMNDYNFKIQEIQRERIFNLCKRVKERGQQLNEIQQHIDEEDIYLIGVAYPIQFINHRLKAFFYRSELDELEIEKVLGICRKLLNS